ncbi:hypothetical protein [Streptomyces sp. NPDC050585]|uniref:hypothetical protein n=1 Tax=Streptomyces sp. NPDC050585 TaxID=3365632 RepID=UPI003794B2EC
MPVHGDGHLPVPARLPDLGLALYAGARLPGVLGREDRPMYAWVRAGTAGWSMVMGL